jgi:hypothetical protein
MTAEFSLPELQKICEGKTIKMDQFCRKIATCLGMPLLTLALVSASGQEVNVQRNPIVIHATAHTTTQQPLREMTPEPWHNLGRVMIEHDRAPFRHISPEPDALTQTEVRAGWRLCAARHERFGRCNASG